MIPTYPTSLVESFSADTSKIPKKVFKIDWDNNRLLSQKIDKTEAVSQNIDVITAVEYQEHESMPDWFGLEMKNMIGMPPHFVKANMERLIKEAVSPYLVVKRLYDFEIRDIDNESIEVIFKVVLEDESIFEKELKVKWNV